ncbi:putative nitric oxide synthase isoform X2 [Macadamia integrifolia]|uniref:putative nitric oxide synthase isoform X2 n=1 Tax=Macadamia integrifolia TaxID=60698 RepID=UPI001C4F2233|nr:putative nitric oxide synthase isoform X2 [Macadamia integrifolia]
MAPNSLFSSSVSLSPLSLSHQLGNPIPCLIFRTHHKPTLITCKTTDSDAQRQSPIFEANASIPNVELEGTGAAAMTRGQLFLERQQSMAAAALVLASEKKKKKGKKSNTGPKLSSAIACCYGCGAPLQTSEVDGPGYVNSETYELKKKHRQLKTVLCGRCRLLSHGHMVTAVGGNGGYSGGKQFISAEELREKLSHLRHEKALIVKLVDIVDFNGSFLTRIRDLAGANPIILVVTKVDLLPKGTNFNCIGDWVVEATMKKKLNVLSVHLTSSKSLVGITGVASEIQREKKGRDVYILGSANVGKSAFINALLKMMAEKDPVAASAQKYKPIQSAVPGTTLGPIQIDAFLGGGKLFDTPGVHLHHRQAAVVHSEDLPALAPRSRLRGLSFPATSHERNGEINGNDLNGFTLFWGGLVRIDVLEVHPSTRLTFYGPKALQIHMRELGVLLTPPTGKQRDDNWAGLEIVHELHIKVEDQNRPACDVAISGLGWITVETINKLPEGSDLSNPEEYTEQLHLAVHVPKPVEIFVRPPIPVGKNGGEWYEYRDLTEKEEELRPKWYF